MNGVCQGCGAAIPPSRGNRPRKWCSNRCRKAQYGGTCADCGTRTDGSNGQASAPQRCRSCQEHRNDERNARIFAAWERGDPAKLIAEREGLTDGAIFTFVDWYRRERGMPVARRQRPNRELWPLIERRWRDGATAAEIAVECDTTYWNVAVMVQAMRKAGIDLPYRSPRRVAA